MIVDVLDPTSTTLHLVGDFDALSVAEAAPALVHFQTAPPMQLHIDATRATFLDSTGIAALAMAADAVRRHGGDVTSSASDTARRLIELCGLTELIGYAPN
ncbi:MAG: hypothetical protein JWN99_574 [Ilumatobacteraceae bacterium]|nr:hypothetical protein [Ilumatobacteraceae bacterium]